MTDDNDAKLKDVGSSKPAVSKRLLFGYVFCYFVVMLISQFAFNKWLSHTDLHKAVEHSLRVAVLSTIGITGFFYHYLCVNKKLMQTGQGAKVDQLFRRMKSSRKAGQPIDRQDLQEFRLEANQLNKTRLAELRKRSPSLWVALAGIPVAIAVALILEVSGFFDLIGSLCR